ncbi:MAG: hypothetical protein GX814_01310 [Microbacteriaceae bacterium]|nr:hypothetical protein [Microbacteriaceae bacterium]
MSQVQQSGEVTLSTRAMVPSMQRVGNREIEVTFLGNNTHGQPTWVLWNPNEPYLIGMLIQGKLGFDFEQRTDSGVMLHENISLQRVQRALAGY